MFSAILGLMKGTRRWKKSSKCKRLMKHLKLRLSIQKSRRIAVIRQSRADIAQLLQKGLHAIALGRVEQLYQDQIRLSAYDQLDGFCDYVSENLSQISRLSECKLAVEVVEAVSSLIFGGSRCGELPELNSIRCLFKQIFGQKFERINVELLLGNTVNSQLTHNLDSSSVARHHVKLQLLHEIKDEYSITSSMSPTQESNSIRPGINQHNEDPDHHQPDNASNFRDQIQASKFEEMLKKFGKNLCFANNASLGSCDGTVMTWYCSPRRQADHDLHKDRIRGISTSPWNHVHQKLPDYDELATKI